MNVFLLPYTWPRHLAMALWCGGAGLLAWWGVLTVIVLGVDWPPAWDGPMLMSAVSGSVAAASILGEGNLRRLPLLSRLWRTALALGLGAVLTLVWYLLWHLVADAVLFGGPDHEANAGDASLVSLTYRFGAFAMGGLGCGSATMVVRKLAGLATQLTSGLAAGLGAGAAWHVTNSYDINTDLYLSGAVLGLTWGLLFGLLAWGIPDKLYAGWVRVLTPRRYGRRIPIDALDGSPKERFIGHFPRGLDLFLPVDDSVMELHVSVAVDDRQRYRLRGLSLAPTKVKRFLERVDLRYDPRRPAPLETNLASGDRVLLGEGAASTEIEFIMLPREER